MTYANPAGESPAAAAAYVASLLALLGDKDPLVILSASPAALAASIEGVSEASLTKAEAPGKWSVAGVLQHLADSEVVNGYRIRLMLSAETPPIPAYDQDAWAAALRYDAADPSLAMKDFAAARAANLRLWRSLGESGLRRAGLHAERGLETVGQLIRLLAGHDLVHRGQITRILGGRAS
jgi:hypothetical protein